MDKDKLIDLLVKEKGGTRQQYLSLLNTIAYHESGGTLDPQTKQFGGGPGRGKHQFETGENEGGITAVRRGMTYLKKKNEDIPEWLSEASKSDSLDATTLTSDQQDFLFLVDKRMHPKADFAKLWNGKETVEDFWADYHWSGSAGKRDERIASFKSSQARLNKTNGVTQPAPEKKHNTQYVQPQQIAQDNTAVAQQDASRQELKAPEVGDGYDFNSLMQHIAKPASNTEQFNSFETGGSHEANPNGGVPIGVGGNGQQNTVEEGETSFEFGDDKFIFSDRISLTDYVKGKGTASNQFAEGGPVDPPKDALLGHLLTEPTDSTMGPKTKANTPARAVPTAPRIESNETSPSSPNINYSGLANVLFNTDEQKVGRGQQLGRLIGTSGAATPREKLDGQFSKIHRDANKGCLAGSLNCSQDFLSKETGLPGLRTIMANSGKDFSQYYIGDNAGSEKSTDYRVNNNLDAWEIHEALEGEGLGTRLLKPGDDVTYSKDSYLPDGFDYSQITLGSIVGQGDSSQKYTKPTDGERSRHAMLVVGFDEKDGMPMVYDYGNLKRLDDPGILQSKQFKINNITIPTAYAGYTKEKVNSLMNEEKVRLGLDKAKPVAYNSESSHISAISEGANKVRDKIAYNYGIPANTMNSLAKYLPGLSNQETKIGNNEGTSKSIIADNAFGNGMGKEILKDAEDAVDWISNVFKEEGEYKQDYELEIEAYKKYPNDEKKFKEHFKELQEERGDIKKRVNFSDNNDPSVGPFAIKDVTEFTKNNLGISKKDLYGTFKSNEDEIKVGAQASLAFLGENYAKFKKKHSDLTEEQLVKLTLVSYNNNGKANDPEFIKHYIVGNKLKDNYLEKLMAFSPK